MTTERPAQYRFQRDDEMTRRAAVGNTATGLSRAELIDWILSLIRERDALRAVAEAGLMTTGAEVQATYEREDGN